MGLLKQALSCGRGTDVRFKTADGVKVGGHSAVLALSCDGFREMFESGMREEEEEEEEEEGIVVIGGVQGSAIKALLEWAYLGEFHSGFPTLDLAHHFPER